MARVKYVPPGSSPRRRSSRPLLPAPSQPHISSYTQETVFSADSYTDQIPAISATGPSEPPSNDAAAATGMGLFGPWSRRNAVSEPSGLASQV
jgi:hypothetical protein